jgi:nucleoside-diphosphate-sugar epimerase
LNDGRSGHRRAAVLVGGSGFVGSAAATGLIDQGWQVTVIDVAPPPRRLLDRGVDWRRCDLLVDDLQLPDGDVVLLHGTGDPRNRWAWHQPLQTVVTTGRLAPLLAGRRVVVCSSLEVYGVAPPPLTEDTEPVLPWSDEKLWLWLERGRPLFEGPCPPWRAAAWCRELCDADPTGRWIYGMSKRAQELLVADAMASSRVEPAEPVLLRLANTVGPGQERVVARFARRAVGGRELQVSHPVRRSFVPAGHVATVVAAGVDPGTYLVGSRSVELIDLARRIVDSVPGGATLRAVPVETTDSCGHVERSRLDDLGLGVDPPERWLDDAVASILTHDAARIHPPIAVVVPPRAARPDLVTERQQAVLWSGAVKHGNRWSTELEERLAERLDLGPEHRLLATTSGTDALRILCGSIVGPAQPGQVVALPSFTFPATAEVVAQLGYRVRFVDVDDRHWTMEPTSLRAALAPGDVALVVAVDTFGNPVDYPALRSVCDEAGVPFVADSAAALGSSVDGVEIGTQALGHAFSMSFAKVLSAGGAGGAVVVPADVELDGPFGWTRSALMNELHAVVSTHHEVVRVRRAAKK